MFGFTLIMPVDYFSILFPSPSGRVAALNMLKKSTKIESVPFFWTVLLGKSIRYTGLRGFHWDHFSLVLKHLSPDCVEPQRPFSFCLRRSR